MAVDFQHSDYTNNIDAWNLVDTFTSGKGVEAHLVTLNPNDTSKENVTRNAQYRERAVFYGIAGQTLAGLNGLLYRKYPEIVLPKGLEYLLKNADGSGVSIYQQAQQSTKECIKKGRFGLYVTFPPTDGQVSRADIISGKYIATIHKIDANQIINVQVKSVGSKIMLSKVVIKEVVEELADDGFEVELVDQWKELSLDDGVFVVRDWRKVDGMFEVVNESTPKDSKNQTWEYIPFVFGGATANTPQVDEVPMLALCEVNKGHFRNSADYEDSVFFCGQTQSWMSGVTQNHIDMMKENNMYVGSRQLLAVPQGESFGFESAEANPMVRQAMLDKVDAMIGLGARYLQPGGVAKTATEANNDSQVQHSILSLISSNTSEAYEMAIAFCGRYMGIDVTDTNTKFKINMDFVDNVATSQEIQAMVAGFIQGAIPTTVYFDWMKKVELLDNETTLEMFNEEMGKTALPDLGNP